VVVRLKARGNYITETVAGQPKETTKACSVPVQLCSPAYRLRMDLGTRQAGMSRADLFQTLVPTVDSHSNIVHNGGGFWRHVRRSLGTSMK